MSDSILSSLFPTRIARALMFAVSHALLVAQPAGEAASHQASGSSSAPLPAANSTAVQAPQANSASVAPPAPLQMEAVEVGARREAFYNSIDRKVYHVGEDISSTTGSASDLLQNVPSIQVDVEGNVSLRGDAGVEILINGKPSALMGRNRADALEQLPADSIERVEIITNPSARYRPDGTGGIINLVMKRERDPGFTGSVRGSVGNDRRYNGGVSATFGRDDYAFHGSVWMRQNHRENDGDAQRTRYDTAGNIVNSTVERSTNESRPLVTIARAGAEYRFGRETKLTADVSYDTGKGEERGVQMTTVRDASGAITREASRVRNGRETEREYELELAFEHAFATERREITAEVGYGAGRETETDQYETIFLSGGAAGEADATRDRAEETEFDFSIDYIHPFSDLAKLELGYELEREKSDLDFQASHFDPATKAWLVDSTVSNRFVHDSAIHGLYGTFGQSFGKFGFLAGARYEHAVIDTRQITAGVDRRNDYGRIYPSLHLNYAMAPQHQLQLSYSHRVNRPDGDDLNPFPRYSDPFNLSAGNPNLVPEDTHAIEAGYQFDGGDTTYIASVYFRHRYHGITEVTRYLDAHTLLTTPDNLATSRAGGLELGATHRAADTLSLNFSANIYRSEVDAANLGFAGRRAVVAWDAKLNTNWAATPRLRLQLTTGYTARRLTAQGAREPSFVANFGARFALRDRRTALIVTISDVFNSMQNRSTIDTPLLRGVRETRRSSQIIYLGFTHSFGRIAKRNENELEFDETL